MQKNAREGWFQLTGSHANRRIGVTLAKVTKKYGFA